MMSRRLQPRFDRIKRVEREVDREACDGASLSMQGQRSGLEGGEKRTMSDLVHSDIASGGASSTGSV